MDSTQLQAQESFTVRRLTNPAVKRYSVTSARPDGSAGETVAFAEQKALTPTERTTVWTDESRERVLCTFEAGRALDLGAVYTVRDDEGNALGTFHEKPVASLLRTTWVLGRPGHEDLTGRERNAAVAVLRRVWDFLPFTDFVPFVWPHHFDFTEGADGGKRGMTVDRRFGLRARYVIRLTGPGLDRRLAIAQAVALDALRSD